MTWANLPVLNGDCPSPPASNAPPKDSIESGSLSLINFVQAPPIEVIVSPSTFIKE
jgi:hypothetical protein